MENIINACPAELVTERDGVEYPTAEHRTYDSKTTGLTRGVCVVLPKNYNKNKKYPVCYMLHGIFGDEYSMVRDCKIITLAHNLFLDGKAPEMILVSPDMFAKSDPDDKPAFTSESSAIYDNFINDLADDLMPFMSENYSILEGRENTAISGFSMGGRETLYIGVTRPDLFGYICAVAPAPGVVANEDHFMKHDGTITPDKLAIRNDEYKPYCFMMNVGTEDGVVGPFPRSYNKILTENGTDHIFYLVDGAGHNNDAVHSGYLNFFLRIFK